MQGMHHGRMIICNLMIFLIKYYIFIVGNEERENKCVKYFYRQQLAGPV